MKQWGGRFEKAASASAEASAASFPFDVRLYPEDILGSVAHCRMLARQGILAPTAAPAASSPALGEMYQELARRRGGARSRLEDVHTLVESRLAARLGDDAGRLHTARSRNDQVATRPAAVRPRGGGRPGRGADRAAAGVGRARARPTPTTVMPGYTHLQRAQPILLAHHLLAYVECCERDAGRLRDAYGA